MSVRKRIINCLENVGIIVDDTHLDDINLLEFGLDSLGFVSLIVEIEQEFNILFPEEILFIDILKSMNGLITLVEDLIKRKEVK